METGQKAARALALTLCVVAAGCAEHHGVHWGYEGQGKPSEWSALSPDFKACNIGTQQSPIDIRTDEAVSADIPPLTIDWTSFQPEVENNGHTIKVRTKGQGGTFLLAENGITCVTSTSTSCLSIPSTVNIRRWKCISYINPKMVIF